MDATSAAATLAAITAVGVAAWQARLQQQSLRHSLYEKRINCYQTVMKYLDDVCATGGEAGKEVSSLRRAYYEAELLFPKEVAEFIFELIERGQLLARLNVHLELLQSQQAQVPGRIDQMQEDKANELKWFGAGFATMKGLCRTQLQINDGGIDSWSDVFERETDRPAGSHH